MITRFNAVGLGGKKSFKCSCGKRVIRQKRFEQTLNPYNRTKDGRVKTQGEIMAECSAERASSPRRRKAASRSPGFDS